MLALVIEDDGPLSQMLVRCLSNWGWVADHSGSIHTALERLRRRQYDVAICDGSLPDGNGVFLARALMQARPTLRVIVISGEPANLRKARDFGITDCLLKPFEIDTLKRLVGDGTAMKA